MTSKISLLLYPSLRGRAFIQNIVKNKIELSNIILMNNKYEKSSFLEYEKFDFFDPNEKVRTTLKKNDLSFSKVESNNCNDSVVVEELKKNNTEWVIYSGGGILKDEILSLGIKFIHIHPGKLPDYKGSTCFYYSFLNEGKCTCTAFIMDKNLDSGEILHSKEFHPPRGIDFDYIYDNWMRSETLVEVIKKIRKGHVKLQKNKSKVSDMYYIIHPVLKHISLLRNNNEI